MTALSKVFIQNLWFVSQISQKVALELMQSGV